MPVTLSSGKSIQACRFGEGIRPTSVYNIEYNPKIIVRKTTGYARMDKPDPINEKSEENKFK